MKTYEQELRGLLLIDALPPEVIQAHLNHGHFKLVQYRSNNMIHLDGEMCTKLEIIISGTIVVERIDESGHLLTVSEFTRGDILGGNLLFSRNPYFPMTITSKSDAKLLEINKETLIDLLNSHHEFLLTYLQFLSDRTFVLSDKIKHYMGRTIRESILNYLNYERKKQHTDTIRLPMTKKELAETIGIQRTSLSRELAKMRDDGLVVYDRETITLL